MIIESKTSIKKILEKKQQKSPFKGDYF